MKRRRDRSIAKQDAYDPFSYLPNEMRSAFTESMLPHPFGESFWT